MKKILVLSANYPNNKGGVSMMYVHTRNKYYIKHGIDVTVLNFCAKENYTIDGIKVITSACYKKSDIKYDTLVLHAANIRNHYLFLRKNEKKFEHIIFFYHGHEVLKLSEAYPPPYKYIKRRNSAAVLARDLYDIFKLKVWHKYLPKLAYKSDYVFVSKWMYNEFCRSTDLTEADLKKHTFIINNSVGRAFEENSYSFSDEKKYDFITVRSFMDDSKYCIDLVNELAVRYPMYSFLVIGRGKFYEINKIPSNVTWINKFLKHEEIVNYIDQSRCGLMMTREDTQGVMTCELAVYGLPVITSDMAVCREICGDIENVALIDNDLSKSNLTEVYEKLISNKNFNKTKKFNYENTVRLEELLILNGRDALK